MNKIRRDPSLNCLERGGETHCALWQHDGDLDWWWGIAVCSDSDGYCKRTGRLIAYARAMWAHEHELWQAGPDEIGYRALRAWAAERGIPMPEEAANV